MEAAQREAWRTATGAERRVAHAGSKGGRKKYHHVQPVGANSGSGMLFFMSEIFQPLSG